MDIPKIGGARGVFEIFVPGLFLWFNGLLVVYSLPWTPQSVKGLLASGAGDDVPVGIALSVVFGYLFGLLLRLYRCERLDSLSAWWLRLTDRKSLKDDGVCWWTWWIKLPVRLFRARKKDYKYWAGESFPYIRWMHAVCSEKIDDGIAHEVWRKYWSQAQSEDEFGANNRQFYNYRKIFVIAKGGLLADEIYAAEALTRYMAGMSYALVAAFLGVAATAWFRCKADLPYGTWAALSGVYAIALFLIVINFRLIRLKEVETLFASDVSMHIGEIMDSHSANS